MNAAKRTDRPRRDEAQREPERSAQPANSPKDNDDCLLDGLVLLCKLYNRPATRNELTAGLPLENGRITAPLLRRAARRADLDVTPRQRAIKKIQPELLPVLILHQDDSVSVLAEMDGEKLTIIPPDVETRRLVVSRDWLEARHSGLTVFASPLARRDDRAGDAGADPHGRWFWSEIAGSWRDFLEVAFAAALASIPALASSLFAMQVYDRVVPNLAFPTLWVLAIGIGLAIVIEAVVRVTRVYLMDAASI